MKMIKRWQNIILDCFRIVSAFNCTVHSAQWTLSQRPSVIVHRPSLSSSTISVSSLAPSFLNRRRRRQRSMFQNASLTQWLNASLRQCPVFTFLVRRNAVFVSLVDSQRAQSMLNPPHNEREREHITVLYLYLYLYLYRMRTVKERRETMWNGDTLTWDHHGRYCLLDCYWDLVVLTWGWGWGWVRVILLATVRVQSTVYTPTTS